MISWVVFSVACLPSVSRAQTLHVYGPEGNGRERRCLAALERADGTCAAWDDVDVQVRGEGSVELGEPLGPCARWITLRSERESSPSLGALIDGVRVETVVSLGEPTPLVVHLVREGGVLRAQVDDVAPEVPLRAWAVWAGGRVELFATDEGLTGEVPVDVMVGVVVRANERTGASALAPASGGGRPELLVMPSDLAVSAGSAARPVAFLVVADARGRLSRSVPLNIQSDRATLARLDWVEPGLARVWLSTEVGEGRVDLTVQAEETVVSTELAAQSGWPVSAVMELPERVEEGSTVDVVVAAHALDGSAVPWSSVEVRWGAEDLAPGAPGHFTGVAPREAQPVVVFARVDGARVPLAWARVAVTPRVEIAALEEVVVVPSTPRVHPHPLRLAAGASFALDLWARASAGGLVSGRIFLEGPAWLELWARYTATWTLASPQGIATDALLAITHSAELAVLTRLTPFGSDVPLGFFGGIGAAVDFLDGTSGTVHVTSETLTGLLVLGVGGTFLVDGFSIGVDAHVRASTPLSYAAWDAPWLRVGIDLTGGFDVTP